MFYRNGTYYFLYSENDTRSEDYRVRYATSTSPMGEMTIPKNSIILSKRVEQGIYGPGSNSVLKVNGNDVWFIVYPRFRRPNAVRMGWAAAFSREVCMVMPDVDQQGPLKVV